jgi:ubiquinone biosynthesis protein
MIRSLRNAWRLFALARTLARHDAMFVFEGVAATQPLPALARLVSGRREAGRPGQRLARALQDAGPSFIKLGQALSTRADLLGDAITADLSELQDRLPPFPGATARAIIEEELGRPIEALFRTFDDQAIAAASIAQVHFATDTDGREVAVKVLRPGVEKAFARDLDLFFWIAELIEDTVPAWRRLRPVESIRIIADSVATEMDLRFEAAAACELAENFAGDPTLKIPTVDWTRTGRRVLTIERIQGIKIDERQALIDAGHDPLAILERAARMFFFQVFRDGFFHGDLHAGNLFVREDGSVAAIDFGIMGRLDRNTRRYLGEMLLAFLMRDYRRAAEVHFEAGWIGADRSVDQFAQACRSIAEPIMDRPQDEISMARLLGQLFQVTETFAMPTQPQLLLLQKTMLVAEGTGRKLCPEANMWILARPLIQDWVAETFGPQAAVRQTVDALRSSLARLPEVIAQAERSLALLADGRLRLHPDQLEALRAGGQRRPKPPVWLAWGLAAVVAAALVLT